ncbi:RepB-like protein [Lactococcus lactis]|nr:MULTISPECIES: RepB-like protein [Lactococcus]OAJ96442.1 RepB-like protein [Lactococcus lactis]UXV62288.1 DNA-binding protein [Lactococcus cremoris]
MSEKLKTIKELADELGVSKKKIHYQVSKLDSDLIQKLDGTIYLDNRAITAIKENIGYVSKTKLDSGAIQNRQHLDSELDTQNTKLIHEKSEQINYLKEQIKNKDNQISVKDEQIKSLVEAQKQIQNLLDQQQRLALQDKKLLEEYKSEINELKSLKMPQEDKKENQSQEEVQTIKKQMEALNDKIKGQEQLNNQVSKKWYQFWK